MNRTMRQRQTQATSLDDQIDLMRQHLADDCGVVTMGPTTSHDGHEYLDTLLSLCQLEDGECSVCSRIICPHGDTMHFHHDCCPSCSDCD